MTIIARFSEHERYDINDDCDKVVMMATTARGSFWTEIEKKTSGNLREQRAVFKQYAAECISTGAEPCQIDMGAGDG